MIRPISPGREVQSGAASSTKKTAPRHRRRRSSSCRCTSRSRAASGCLTTNTTPSLISRPRCAVGARVRASGYRALIRPTHAADQRKLSASTSIAHGAVEPWISTPPTLGPAIWLTDSLACSLAVALDQAPGRPGPAGRTGRRRRRTPCYTPTTHGRRRRADRSSARRARRPAGSSRARRARSRSFTISTQRNRIRSIQRRPAARRAGSRAIRARSARPTSNVEACSTRIATSGSARWVIWVPNWLTVSPIQSRRKSRWCHSPPRRGPTWLAPRRAVRIPAPEAVRRSLRH